MRKDDSEDRQEIAKKLADDRDEDTEDSTEATM
jgi:hypothetical protein